MLTAKTITSKSSFIAKTVPKATTNVTQKASLLPEKNITIKPTTSAGKSISVSNKSKTGDTRDNKKSDVVAPNNTSKIDAKLNVNISATEALTLALIAGGIEDKKKEAAIVPVITTLAAVEGAEQAATDKVESGINKVFSFVKDKLGITEEASKGISKSTLKWLNNGEANNSEYYGIKDGQAVYTGITKQELADRLYQHNYGPAGKGLDYLEEQVSGLTRNQARAIEQYLIENGPANEMNQINSISSKSPYYKEALLWAENYLSGLK